jgi:HEPN domain-containing protein
MSDTEQRGHVRRVAGAHLGTPAEFLRNSIDHLGAAEVLFEGSPSHFDSAGYLAHLSIELFLKGWLLHLAGSFPKTHDLDSLHGELVQSHGILALKEEQLSVLKLLDRYDELRYPNRSDPVEVGTEHVSPIRQLVDSFWQQLPDNLILTYSELDPLQKGGRVLMKKKIE